MNNLVALVIVTGVIRLGQLLSCFDVTLPEIIAFAEQVTNSKINKILKFGKNFVNRGHVR
jgi:hypothetical protein